ncbi:hypothetical protein BKA93DRAFT_829063 [Sparassis latifolia]|uniref:Uncharacterized protein n=1 Tax=Sparassis crispa TaxID=139825 RepID=A0A401GEL4_9APHY|nr:hypothetical protein SCP_0303510 [Sparassis crispa]GBE80634.1 hypothetical protein SCP_0303510 [Sparassis crispa]
MVNYLDPLIIEAEYLSLVKLIHVVCGIYIWEWATNLPFEWKLITHIREIKASGILYISCRVATLAAIICNLVDFNVTTEIDCMVIYRLILSFGYLSLALSSSLIVLRAIAIWHWNVFVVIIVLAVYLLNVGFLIYGIVDSPVAMWDAQSVACLLTDSVKSRANICVTLSSDVTLLLVMLVGIFRSKGGGGLWKVIYHQGVVWLVIATLFYIPPVALIGLNLNDPMNLMLQTPTYVVMAICATRMHRGLYEFAHSGHIMATVTQQSRFVPVNNVEVSSIPLSRFAGVQVETKQDVYDDQGIEVSKASLTVTPSGVSADMA